MKRIVEILTYFICYSLNITRNRFYIVYPDLTVEKTGFSVVPNTIFKKSDNTYYNVISVVGEIKNKTLIYYYIKVEKL